MRRGVSRILHEINNQEKLHDIYSPSDRVRWLVLGRKRRFKWCVVLLGGITLATFIIACTQFKPFEEDMSVIPLSTKAIIEVSSSSRKSNTRSNEESWETLDHSKDEQSPVATFVTKHAETDNSARSDVNGEGAVASPRAGENMAMTGDYEVDWNEKEGLESKEDGQGSSSHKSASKILGVTEESARINGRRRKKSSGRQITMEMAKLLHPNGNKDSGTGKMKIAPRSRIHIAIHHGKKRQKRTGVFKDDEGKKVQREAQEEDERKEYKEPREEKQEYASSLSQHPPEEGAYPINSTSTSGVKSSIDAFKDSGAISAGNLPEERVPNMLYCLPGGGFNDIAVQLWRCVEYAIKTERVMILGYENYIPVLPPYEQYFRLKTIPGLSLMSQWEAADRIRRAEARGQRVTKAHGKRLPISMLLGNGEETEDGPPFFIATASVPNVAFNPEKNYSQHILVYHKKGNRGTPESTIRHVLFSEEVKRTFLLRWGQISKPYVGMHVRGTDRKCGKKKAPQVMRKVKFLRRRLIGAPIYLATDNPEATIEYRDEFEDNQGRKIFSFTYFPSHQKGVEEPAKDRRMFLHDTGTGQTDTNEQGLAGETDVHIPLHLNQALKAEEKHQTNVDSFVDLLLLAFSKRFIKSCGGYSQLAKLLHQDKSLALATLGLSLPLDTDDVDRVLQEALNHTLGDSSEKNVI